MNEQQILLAFGGIGAAAIGCQWLAWRLKLPAILFLLLTGILADASGSLRIALILPALCYAVIAGYGFYARRPASDCG